MTVAITFEPAHLTGLVSEGISVLDAAKRMGLRLPVACAKENCRTCVVQINAGAELLSAPSEAEQRLIDEGVLATDQRLACLAIFQSTGEFIVTIPETDERNVKQDNFKDFRKSFSELPLGQKLTALVQLEAVTMSEALNTVMGKTMSVGGKLTDLFLRKARPAKKAEPKQGANRSSRT